VPEPDDKKGDARISRPTVDRWLTDNSLFYDDRLALIDRHGFVRAQADAFAALQSGGSLPPSPEHWLQHAFTSAVATEPVAARIGLDALVRQTSLQGLLLPSLAAAPAEIELSPA
jgi:hypothetical protein